MYIYRSIYTKSAQADAVREGGRLAYVKMSPAAQEICSKQLHWLGCPLSRNSWWVSLSEYTDGTCCAQADSSPRLRLRTSSLCPCLPSSSLAHRGLQDSDPSTARSLQGCQSELRLCFRCSDSGSKGMKELENLEHKVIKSNILGSIAKEHF